MPKYDGGEINYRFSLDKIIKIKKFFQLNCRYVKGGTFIVLTIIFTANLVIFIELQEKNTLHRTCVRGKICYRSESYVRDDRGRRLRGKTAHPPSPL